MTEVLRFRVEKLIRDGLPQIMRRQGLQVFERVLDDAEYLAELRRKLVEEAAEAASADADSLVEELADVLEVVIALAQAGGASLADVEAKRLAKRAERGGFEGRVYNACVEAQAGTAAAAYYLARPEQYPRL
ncbi:nucleoside triphosphate pyrophosphohydrolase [Phenylobacterium sp.]|jgi:predicted house-cleaning noncanonical NTP pyrophosphatase (MazG superfamily)|uniref:nucleoside triphosphate pyrophosphohydrolase n=1 Tax=Phenylobacterium sp. TaxID=1871053 RepID=UPI002E3008C1|nr:nucleoside triphosphate pyrophosphohydrolase [Phenylobacterium sp.]HEX2558948.1 nucleoside triphosphate pyrophosphohydrolase [Phenylobacterium sp.]